MCEITHGMAGERHGNGMGAAWARHAMCESALSGWSDKFSASTIDGNNIGNIFFPKLVICHKHPCGITNHSIK
jgi:hypothetical protein